MDSFRDQKQHFTQYDNNRNAKSAWVPPSIEKKLLIANTFSSNSSIHVKIIEYTHGKQEI